MPTITKKEYEEYKNFVIIEIRKDSNTRWFKIYL